MQQGTIKQPASLPVVILAGQLVKKSRELDLKILRYEADFLLLKQVNSY